MSSVDEIFSYVFAWHALSDACPKCRLLDGQEFRDQDLYQERLFSVIWGDIWDLNVNHSLAHPNCRCQLEVRVLVDWSRWRELQELRGIVSKACMAIE